MVTMGARTPHPAPGRRDSHLVLRRERAATVAVLGVAYCLAWLSLIGCGPQGQQPACGPGRKPCGDEAATQLSRRYTNGLSWCIGFHAILNDIGLPDRRGRNVLNRKARFDPPDRVEYWTGCRSPGQSADGQYRLTDIVESSPWWGEAVLGFFSPEALSHQRLRQVSGVPFGPYGDRNFSGRLPSGEAITYAQRSRTGQIAGIQVATHTYYVVYEHSVQPDMPCRFSACTTPESTDRR